MIGSVICRPITVEIILSGRPVCNEQSESQLPAGQTFRSIEACNAYTTVRPVVTTELPRLLVRCVARSDSQVTCRAYKGSPTLSCNFPEEFQEPDDLTFPLERTCLNYQVPTTTTPRIVIFVNDL